MLNIAERITASTAPNQTVEVDGRTLAYRRFCSGPELVLCIRLRGTMDMWDPLFLDSLAEHFTVTTFDYSGLGPSTGAPNYGKIEMAKDVNDLVDALDLGKVVIGGWSLGGFAAQVSFVLSRALTEGIWTIVSCIGRMPRALAFAETPVRAVWKLMAGMAATAVHPRGAGYICADLHRQHQTALAWAGRAIFF